MLEKIIEENKLQIYKNLVIAVDRYRIAHSIYESNNKKTTELHDAYVDMLVVCDSVKQFE